MEKDFPSKRTPKATGVAVPICDKISFKPKLVRRDKESYFILIFIINFHKDIFVIWGDL
jgi:hypothetical protein